MSAAEQAPIAELAARAPQEAGHTDAVRDMFGRIAPTYDLLNRVLSGGLDAAWRKRAIDSLAGAPRGASLDLCAGTLDLTVLLGKARPTDRLIASDFSERMLDLGRSKVPRAEIVIADAQALPFADASIAATVCGFGVRNVADPRKALREIRRVMSPGGVFVTLEFFRPARLATRVFHKVYASLLLPAVGGLLSGDRAAYAYLARSMDGFLSRPEYEAALRGAGFIRVQGQDLTLGVASIVRAEISVMTSAKKIIVGITGASGAPYAKRLIAVLAEHAQAGEVELGVCVSQTAPDVWALECGGDLREELGVRLWGGRDYSAPFASGSAGWHAMIVIPCSMSTVAKVAHGISDTLLTRAADVMLKERRPLVLVPRETPLSLVHLENLTQVTRAGALVLPAMPSFYGKPQSIDALVDTVVARALDHLGVSNRLSHRWGSAS